MIPGLMGKPNLHDGQPYVPGSPATVYNGGFYGYSNFNSYNIRQVIPVTGNGKQFRLTLGGGHGVRFVSLGIQSTGYFMVRDPVQVLFSGAPGFPGAGFVSYPDPYFFVSDWVELADFVTAPDMHLIVAIDLETLSSSNYYNTPTFSIGGEVAYYHNYSLDSFPFNTNKPATTGPEGWRDQYDLREPNGLWNSYVESVVVAKVEAR